MSTAYARYSEEDGDGLTRTPRDAENVLGTSPNRTLNGGFRWISNRYQNFQSEIRFDFTDYQHQYYVSPKDSLLSVITESASDFNLSYRNYFAYASQSLYLGSSSISLSVLGQRTTMTLSMDGWKIRD